MSRLLLLLLVACGGPAADAADAGPDAGDPSADLYDPEALPHLELTLSATAIESLTIDPFRYVPGELRWGDEVVPDVAVRLKGTTSFQPIGRGAWFVETPGRTPCVPVPDGEAVRVNSPG